MNLSVDDPRRDAELASQFKQKMYMWFLKGE